MLKVLKCKIHKVKVTQADVNYRGSITIDRHLMDAAGIKEYEMVHINNAATGVHWETYAIPGTPGSGCICLNGAAALNFKVGDPVHIICYHYLHDCIVKHRPPTVVHCDQDNMIQTVEGGDV